MYLQMLWNFELKDIHEFDEKLSEPQLKNIYILQPIPIWKQVEYIV